MASSRAAQAGPSAAVSRGLWLLPVAGVIIAVVTALWFTGPSGDDPATNAKFMAGGMALIVGGWLYFVGLFALILGIQALYGALATSRGQGWALGGLALGVGSVAALLAAFGAAALGGAIVADSYLHGNTGAADAMQKLQGGSFGAAIQNAFGVAYVLALVGAIAFGVAIWRSGTLPRWTAIVFGIGFMLVALSFPVATTLGGVLLVVSGVAIVRASGREAVAGETAPAIVQPA